MEPATQAFVRGLFRDDDAEPVTPPETPQQAAPDPVRDFTRRLFQQSEDN